MKTFTVEGHGWSKDVKVDDTLFPDEAVPFEAMIQALEGFFAGDYEEDYSEEEVGLALFMVSYEKGKGHKDDERVMALTEFVLTNAGYHEMGKEFKTEAVAELKKEMELKKKKKKDE